MPSRPPTPSPPWLDLALAAALVVAGEISVTTNPATAHPLGYVAAAVLGAAVGLRTRAPQVMVATWVVAVHGLPAIAGPDWLLVGALVVTFSTGSRIAARRATVWFGLLLVSVSLPYRSVELGAESIVSTVVLIGGPFLAGVLLRRARGRAAELAVLAAELDAERDHHRVLAVEAERLRVARDLHDILGHSLTVVVVQAGAAGQLVRAGDPAAGSVGQVVVTARDALGEIRSLITLTRGAGAEPSPSPVPVAPDGPPVPPPARRVGWWDVVLALLAGGLALGTGGFRAPNIGDSVLVPVLTVLVLGAVVLGGRASTMAPLVVAGGCALLARTVLGGLPLWAFPVVLVTAFEVLLRLRGRRAYAVAAAVLAAAYTFPSDQTTVLGLVVTPLVLVGGPAVAGGLLSRSVDDGRRLAALHDQLRAERTESAELAANAERLRISDELHDVLAHTLTSVAVQAGAAGQLLEAGHPAQPHLDAVLVESRRSLVEVRTLLSSGGPQEAGPAPTLAEVKGLVADAGGELRVNGQARPVPAGLALAAYRVVQESLTNARRHAPGSRPLVTLTYAPDALRVCVVNTAEVGEPLRPRPDRGHGLLGMAERVHAHAGVLKAAPRPEGGWSVDALLPWPASAST